MREAQWKPASGYRSQSGRSLWRVVRERVTDTAMRGTIEEYSDSRGRRRLYVSHVSAQRVARKLNQDKNEVSE